MTMLSQAAMAEATRLTREGRLEEAMSVLRGALGAGPAGSAPQPASAPARGEAGAPPILDLEPPAPGSGGAWTWPGEGARPAREARGEGARIWSRPVRPGRGGSRRPAPVPIPEGASFEERVFTNAAGSRPYKLYVPSRAADAREMPVVVMLHGCTQSPDDFAMGTRMNEVAEEEGFLVVYPGQTRGANASLCWNWFNPADQEREGAEPSLIAGITRAVIAERSADSGRVYVAGLSAGGAKAAIMGATHPDLFAAVGVHSGLACGAARDVQSAFAAMKQGAAGSAPAGGDARAVPTIVFHGDRDTTVAPVNAGQVAAAARAGARLDTRVERGQAEGGRRFTRILHRDAHERAMLEEWTLHGAGHAWSGGSAAGSYTDPTGPDASRAMIRFFLGHGSERG